jgi:hypothetical protein
MPIDKQEEPSSGGGSGTKAMWGIVIIIVGSVLLALVIGVWSHWVWKFFQIGWDYVD